MKTVFHMHMLVSDIDRINSTCYKVVAFSPEYILPYLVAQPLRTELAVLSSISVIYTTRKMI